MIAFKAFQLCPVEQRPVGIPLSYPWIQQECAEENTQAMRANGWTVVTNEEYADYVSSMDDLIAAYEQSKIELSLPAISARQIRLALLSQGITESMIQSSLESLSEPDRSAALVEWNHAATFERNHPLVPNVAGALGWNTDQVNQLWEYAYTL